MSFESVLLGVPVFGTIESSSCTNSLCIGKCPLSQMLALQALYQELFHLLLPGSSSSAMVGTPPPTGRCQSVSPCGDFMGPSTNPWTSHTLSFCGPLLSPLWFSVLRISVPLPSQTRNTVSSTLWNCWVRMTLLAAEKRKFEILNTRDAKWGVA